MAGTLTNWGQISAPTRLFDDSVSGAGLLLRPEGSFCPLRPVDLGTAILWPGGVVRCIRVGGLRWLASARAERQAAALRP
jgi:hypothetical protein